MIDHITIGGYKFEISNKYHEGHECTKGEARALQRAHGNGIKNNLIDKVKDALANGMSAEDVQVSIIDPYAIKYRLGDRQIAPRQPKSPVFLKAMEQAKRDIRESHKRQGITLKQGMLVKYAREAVNNPDLGYMADAERLLKDAQRRNRAIDTIVASRLT